MNHNKDGDNKPRIAVVVPYPPAPTETFITNHIEHLPAEVVTIHGWRPTIGDQTILSSASIAFHKALRTMFRMDIQRETTAGYMKAFRKNKTEAVLAEYGTTGAMVMDACEQLGIPLVVYFFGFDASVHSVLEEHRESYKRMFRSACALVAVSGSIRRTLTEIGAAANKIHVIPCGVDTGKFSRTSPAQAPPLFLAVGRFVDKKAPQLTIEAFAKVQQAHPEARLRMIGDGPLWETSKQLAERLGVAEAVEFPGPLPHAMLQDEMRRARCFVQHSIAAPSGDCEGTPVGILEAGACGLPVVSTRHAGIPEVVIEGETGLLVDERDVEGMARQMTRIVEDPQLAEQLGNAARTRIAKHFSIDKSISDLWSVIAGCLRR